MEGKHKSNKKNHNNGSSPSEQKSDKKKNSAKRRNRKKKRTAAIGGNNTIDCDSKVALLQLQNATASTLTCEINCEVNNNDSDVSVTAVSHQQDFKELKKNNSAITSNGSHERIHSDEALKGNSIVPPQSTVTGTVSESIVANLRAIHINDQNSSKKLKKSSSSGSLVSKKIFKSVSKSKSTTSATPSSGKSKQSKISTSQIVYNESLRWEEQTNDPTEEENRLKVYKMNRRKRYLAERQRLGLDCSVYNSGSSSYSGSSSDSLPTDSIVPTFAMNPIHTHRTDMDIRVNCA
ncbi:uncharacterized protein LOC141900128 [Tubulanus polymorphus]|uniref:uncharacterized protein LOC141900128 n=1 Tax=Tubulanus polymorphus TaxID=672921 RepID=UPI003DA22E10